MFVLLKHGKTPALRRVVDEIVDKQLLIANANSEVGIGGDVMRSNRRAGTRGRRLALRQAGARRVATVATPT